MIVLSIKPKSTIGSYLYAEKRKPRPCSRGAHLSNEGELLLGVTLGSDEESLIAGTNPLLERLAFGSFIEFRSGMNRFDSQFRVFSNVAGHGNDSVSGVQLDNDRWIYREWSHVFVFVQGLLYRQNLTTWKFEARDFKNFLN